LASETLLRAQAGRPLGTEGFPARPVGRIAGDAASVDLAVDWDCCTLDGRPISELAAWRTLLAAGRLAEVRGAFALAWRTPEGELLLARDGLGERPLFYAPQPDGCLFASSIRALLATGRIPRRVCPVGVARYLSYAYMPGRETLVPGVLEVLPGETVTWGPGGLRRRWFWRLPAETGGCEDPRRLRADLETAMRRRLPPGQPVAATLSGGIDSSLVVALAKQLHDAPVSTYSVSFGPEYANELPWSSLVAAHCGTRHHVVELSPEAVLRHLDEAIAMLHEPIGDPLTVPNALLFRTAVEAGLPVVLNGEGGDPCFGGPKNLPMLLAELLGGGDSYGVPTPHARERSFLRAHQKCYDELGQLLQKPPADGVLEGEVSPWFVDARYQTLVTQLQAINVAFKGGHHILAKVDAVSAPFGALPRSPLFDRDVVETAFAIPSGLKLKGSVEKYLLKQAVADLLPQAIIDRPKSGMLVPVEGWFQGPLLPQAKERLLDGLAPWGLVNRVYVEKLLAGKLGGLRPRRGVKIWLLLTLEAWLRTVVAD
jgi:asparagine synthase (glutamine-hydrolysing)